MGASDLRERLHVQPYKCRCLELRLVALKNEKNTLETHRVPTQENQAHMTHMAFELEHRT